MHACINLHCGPLCTHAFMYNVSMYTYIYILTIMCVSVTYGWPNGWADHDQIWLAYVDIYADDLDINKIAQRILEGCVHWGPISEGGMYVNS